MVMTNAGFSGQWLFSTTKTELKVGQNVESFLMPYEEITFNISAQLVSYGFRIMIRTENQTLLDILALKIMVDYNGNEEKLSRQIEVGTADLKGKMPIRLYLFFQEHPIKSITLNSS